MPDQFVHLAYYLFSNIDYDKFLSRILVCIGKVVVALVVISGCRNRLLIIQNYAQVAKIIAFDDCVSIELGKKKEKRERDRERKCLSVF